MKIKLFSTVFLIAILCALLSLAGSVHQTDDPGVLLRAAIEREEVDGDLQGAIDIYKQIITKHGDHRAIAAKAQLHIGLCYEKLGLKEAQKAFQNVIDNYPEQSESVKAAQEKLSLLLKAKDALLHTEGRVLGVALNRLTPRGSGYYYYQYYQYYYSKPDKGDRAARQNRLLPNLRRQ